jgi:hypothetical protein
MQLALKDARRLQIYGGKVTDKKKKNKSTANKKRKKKKIDRELSNIPTTWRARAGRQRLSAVCALLSRRTVVDVSPFFIF